MAKRKKHTGSRSSSDNPLAAARSGKAAKTSASATAAAAVNGAATAGLPKSGWVEFGIGIGIGTPGSTRTVVTRQSDTTKHSTDNNKNASKISKKAEQIWHRRSGAGFHLFVDYYRGQPDGIVVTSSESAAAAATAAAAAATMTRNSTPAPAPLAGGAGLSRAALRRKKKKRKKSTTTTRTGGGPSRNEAVIRESEPLAILPPHRQDQLLHNGRLLDALSAAAPSRNDNSSSGFRDFLVALSKPLPLTFRFRRYEDSAATSSVKTNNSNGNNNGNNNDTIRIPSHQQRRRRIKKIAGLRQILKGPTMARANVRPVPFDPDYIYQAMAPPQISPLANPMTSNTHHPFPVDKASLKRLCPEFKEFLNEHTLDGTIARQEMGSILPVWLLEKVGTFSRRDKTRLLRVLDTCASPGSKTLQVAELVSTTRGGRVRANDVNANRLESLREALGRSGFFGSNSDNDGGNTSKGANGSSSSNSSSSMESLVKFSNMDASRFPVPKSEAKKYPVILCDVPCSGDGTVRKDVHVIPNWTPNISNALHSLQVQILKRALRCVAIHGIVSYSTCSLNPIEDEAVVLAALEKEREEGKFQFELVEVSETQRNGLILHPGVRSWRVADFDPQSTSGDDSNNDTNRDVDVDVEAERDENVVSSDDDEEKPAKVKWYDSYQSALDAGMEGALESMWPRALNEKDDSSSLPLDRCLRLFPQDQDTGGFFVALIRRTK
jgi:16S rRNA C967 or C1407 C5-methylase (RsmB/RsmF family)